MKENHTSYYETSHSSAEKKSKITNNEKKNIANDFYGLSELVFLWGGGGGVRGGQSFVLYP